MFDDFWLFSTTTVFYITTMTTLQDKKHRNWTWKQLIIPLQVKAIFYQKIRFRFASRDILTPRFVNFPEMFCGVSFLWKHKDSHYPTESGIEALEIPNSTPLFMLQQKSCMYKGIRDFLIFSMKSIFLAECFEIEFL